MRLTLRVGRSPTELAAELVRLLFKLQFLVIEPLLQDVGSRSRAWPYLLFFLSIDSACSWIELREKRPRGV
jgi:hypothetical protein